MDLAKLQIELTQNNPEQAIGLGFAVARRFYPTLLMTQLMIAIPLLLLIVAVLWVLPPISGLWALLAYWWCLPIVERVLLWVLSRLIFGESITRQVRIDAILMMLKSRLWHVLSIGRLSPSRSYLAPVVVLERLNGMALQDRQTYFLRIANGFGLSLGFFVLRLFLAGNLIALMYMLIPEAWWADSIIHTWIAGHSFWWVLGVACIFADIVLTPFYVATGLMLYLSQRVNIEGWDIEIQFRLLAARLLKHTGLSMIGWISLGLLSVALCTNNPVMAADMVVKPISTSTTFNSPAHAADQRLLYQITHRPAIYPYEIDRHLTYVGPSWSLKTSETTNQAPFYFGDMNVLATMFKILIIGTVLGLPLWLYYYRDQLIWQRDTAASDAPPKVLFGLDVHQQTAPQDILTAAVKAFSEGDFVLALSLLYRGALINLIHQEALKIRESHTESDCAQLVIAHCLPNKSHYFVQLTQAWQQLVYAHQAVHQDQLAALLTTWASFFQAHDDTLKGVKNQKTTANNVRINPL